MFILKQLADFNGMTQLLTFLFFCFVFELDKEA